MRPAKRKGCQESLETAKRGSGSAKRRKELVNDNLNKIIQRQSSCRYVESDSDEQSDSFQPVRLTHRSVTQSLHARKRDRLVAGRTPSQPVYIRKTVQIRSVKSAGKIGATPMVDSLSDIDGEDQESTNILSVGTQNHKHKTRNKTRRVVNLARSDMDGEDQESNNILSRGTQNHNVASRAISIWWSKHSSKQNTASGKSDEVCFHRR